MSGWRVWPLIRISGLVHIGVFTWATLVQLVSTKCCLVPCSVAEWSGHGRLPMWQEVGPANVLCYARPKIHVKVLSACIGTIPLRTRAGPTNVSFRRTNLLATVRSHRS
ncbi:hypothetical protein JB92DRAFT_2229380 [Gautieria morchelliformis]|nr:hypothetical protein JB92DRAFT_2229380 [Gautieria morchelliformis]